MKTTRDSRRMFVSWLHDPATDRMSIRAWAVGEGMARDCDELEAKCAALQAESASNAKWLEETWPTIEDRELGELVRERDEALAKIAALTKERDENEEIANRALLMGLRCADLARLAGLTVGFSVDFECCPTNTHD